ncbi:MAG: two-component system response regulator NreC [Candidatus Latescibacterota bacterium]|jgi:two-component system response regulator NreC
MIKILVVDDHEIVRQGIMGLLSREREFEVVGEADNGLTAVALAKDLSPDVVLMDLTIPELNGIEATERIIETCHQTRVVVLTMHQDRAHIRRAFEAGASGYILKKNDLGDLIRAIHTVSRGEVFLSPAISRVVVETFVGREDLPISGGKSDGLSHREREVLVLVAEGETNKEIAGTLHIAEKTVAAHRANVMQKLNLKNAADLVRYAIREGMVEL